MKFKEAMSNKTLQEYAETGRLIKKAKIEEPRVPDRAEYRLDSSNPPLIDLEKFQFVNLNSGKPKLFASSLNS